MWSDDDDHTGDEETYFLAEKIHSEDDVKVTGREVVVSLALVERFSSGMARALAVSPRT